MSIADELKNYLADISDIPLMSWRILFRQTFQPK